MGDNFLNDVRNTLDNCIFELDEIHFMFCQTPDSDFTRTRKISFSSFCNFMIQMQSKSLPNEVMDFFGHDLQTPAKSALIQQRDKLLPEGWEFLFRSFVEACHDHADYLYCGYRLLAIDGSDVNICRNPDDEDAFIQEGEKGYNAIHINALFDIMNHTYYNVSVQGKKKLHERKALNQMIDMYCDPVPCIILADRGYEGWNQFAHFIENDQKFLIRMKDIHSNGILSVYGLSDTEHDTYIETTLTKHRTKKTKGHPEIYTILPSSTDFDYFGEDSYYQLQVRIVRFLAADGKYICVATNLSEDEFPLEEVKKLYRLRWSEETSFRELKYTIGLVCPLYSI